MLYRSCNVRPIVCRRSLQWLGRFAGSVTVALSVLMVIEASGEEGAEATWKAFSETWDNHPGISKVEGELSDTTFIRRVYRAYRGKAPTKLQMKYGLMSLQGDAEVHTNSMTGEIFVCDPRVSRREFAYQFAKHAPAETTAEGIHRLVQGGFFDWVPTERLAIKDKTWRKAAPVLSDSLPPFRANTDAYQRYIGNLHSHTTYSDGIGSPTEALASAQRHGHDFYAISDHAVNISDEEWMETKRVVKQFNDLHAGSFVAFAAFEWSHPFVGHITIFNADEPVSFTSHPGLKEISHWLEDHPQALARFNHPGREPWGAVKEFEHFNEQNGVRNQVVGIECFSKRKNISKYIGSSGYNDRFDIDVAFESGFFSRMWAWMRGLPRKSPWAKIEGGNPDMSNFLDEALSKDWDLGVVGGQDDHDAELGATVATCRRRGVGNRTLGGSRFGRVSQSTYLRDRRP